MKREYTQSATVFALKQKHMFLSTWIKQHGFQNSQVHDVLSKRGTYGLPSYTLRKNTNTYAILQCLIREGYSKELIKDGWDPSQIDLEYEVVSIQQIARGKATYKGPVKLEDIQNALCDLGDDYNCNIFYSNTQDAGPRALLFMMEQNMKATNRALLWLRSHFLGYKFYKEAACVITVWIE